MLFTNKYVREFAN